MLCNTHKVVLLNFGLGSNGHFISKGSQLLIPLKRKLHLLTRKHLAKHRMIKQVHHQKNPLLQLNVVPVLLHLVFNPLKNVGEGVLPRHQIQSVLLAFGAFKNVDHFQEHCGFRVEALGFGGQLEQGRLEG